MPATVAAWRADGTKRPIGMFGDASVGMTVEKLETLVRPNVAAIPILFNHGTFGWINGLHRLRVHNHCFGVASTPPKGEEIAGAFDMKAGRARTVKELDDALARSFAHDHAPCLVEVMVEPVADRVPPVHS